MTDALDHRPDILPQTFHPPRWLVLTAGATILAAGIASAAFSLVANLPPRAETGGIQAPAAASANASSQSLRLGSSFVLAEPVEAVPIQREKPTEAPADEVVEIAPVEAAVDPAATAPTGAEPAPVATDSIPF